MGLWDKIKSQLIDIIEWLDDTHDTLVWRFPRYENEIKNGAKLIVREGQVCAFVREGQLADVFGPGTYTLETRNLPILSTIAGWKYGFDSPWKAEAYFVSTRVFTGYKWGTKNPIMLRDPEFGPVRLRAFGTFGVKVSDPPVFLRQVVGTNSRFTVDGIGDQLRDLMVARFADVIGTAKIPVLDIAGSQDELGKFVADKIQSDFGNLGIAVVNLTVENVSLPPEVEQMLDKRTSMGILGDLSKYTQFQAANALGDAAKNPNGLAGAGVGVGLGVGLGQQVAAAMAPGVAQPTITSPGVGSPPPLPQAAAYFVGVGGKQAGPFDVATLAAMASRGEIGRDTLVWKNGMPAWTKAGEVSDLAGVFASVPPPLPA
ncbi:MAG TPA: SPFH domain-containing protein [Tepidisphaeraceae bacterium]|nr:SPFH domain-containing protein [Tepidisphaeraceae bacterium]